MRRFAAKFEIALAALFVSMTLSACQGMYVAGDAGPHSTTTKTR